MFVTHSSAQPHIPIGFFDEDSFSSTYVRVLMHKPWFHVIYKSKPARKLDSLTGILLIDSPEQLLEFASQPVRILEVSVVSPDYVNGTKRWQMEPVTEIRVGTASDGEDRREEFVIVVESGQRYAGPFLTEVGAQLQDEKIVFKI